LHKDLPTYKKIYKYEEAKSESVIFSSPKKVEIKKEIIPEKKEEEKQVEIKLKEEIKTVEQIKSNEKEIVKP
jgi:superfamily II DNA helicase RecQ